MNKSMRLHDTFLVAQRISKPASIILLITMLCLGGCVAPVIEEVPPVEIELPAEEVVEEPVPEPEVQIAEEEVVAEAVDEEPIADDSLENPAQSVVLDAHSVVLEHSDAISMPDDADDWVAFTTAESEADMSWLTLICTGEEESAKAVRVTLWDATGALDLVKSCSSMIYPFELETGHQYFARVHFKEDGDYSAEYTLTVRHTTAGLSAEKDGDGPGPSAQAMDLTYTTQGFVKGEISSPSDPEDWAYISGLPGDIATLDVWVTFSCVGDTGPAEVAMMPWQSGQLLSEIGTPIACGDPPAQFTLNPDNERYYAFNIRFNESGEYYAQWNLEVSSVKP